MPDDDAQDGLRVGGWVPPYPQDGSGSGPRVRPAARPALPAGAQRHALGPGSGPATPLRPRLMLAGAIALACAATTVVAVVLDEDPPPAPVAAQTEEFRRPGLPLDPLRPTGTISLLPPPSTTTSSFTFPPTEAAATKTRSRTASPSRAKPSPSRTTAAPPVAFTVGRTAGLEVADRPGHRVRHRHFRALINSIGAGSSDLDRADARFTVRPGRADRNCFSFESANFPGYYLRHRDFEVRLDRSDRTELFDRDSTFCTVPIRRGVALALRSHNYPAQYVVADGDRLVLRPATADGATAFRPGSPL